MARPRTLRLFYFSHSILQPRPPPLVLARARLTVARPRARPTPRPRVPLDLNIGAFLCIVSQLPDQNSRNLVRSIPQHVRYNEVPHVAASDIDLLKMRHTAVAGCDSNVLELNIHVVLGC